MYLLGIAYLAGSRAFQLCSSKQEQSRFFDKPWELEPDTATQDASAAAGLVQGPAAAKPTVAGDVQDAAAAKDDAAADAGGMRAYLSPGGSDDSIAQSAQLLCNQHSCSSSGRVRCQRRPRATSRVQRHP